MFLELVEPLSRNRDPNMTKHLHVCTICFRPEVVYDVVSGRNVKTTEGYHLLKSLDLIVSGILKNNNFVTAAADIDDTIKRKRIRVSLKN